MCSFTGYREPGPSAGCCKVTPTGKLQLQEEHTPNVRARWKTVINQYTFNVYELSASKRLHAVRGKRKKEMGEKVVLVLSNSLVSHIHRLVNFIPHPSPSPFLRLTGAMNVSHGDDKNPMAAQKKSHVASQSVVWVQ